MKLPNGWRKDRLGDLVVGNIRNGYSPVCDLSGDTCGWMLSLGALTPHGLDYSQRKAAPVDPALTRVELQDNDILISRSNTPDRVGMSSIFHVQEENYFYPDLMMRFQFDSDRLLPLFGWYYLNTPEARSYFKRKASGTSSSMVKITSATVRSLEIPYPPLPEQRRIAEFLGTWDEAIEKLEQLIAAKEKQQKVLSNHIFDQVKKQEFQQCRLVNICAIHKGVQLGKFEMNAKGRYPVLNGGISYSGYTDSYNCEANTIAISEGGNSCGFVNLIREKFWCGGHCYTLKNIRISMQYLFFFLKHRQDMLMNLRVGSGLPNIQKKDLENVEVVFPIMEEEQNRFSEILLCTQNELDLLRKKLAALQKQKRGLMQKLLTGTWRG